MENTLTNEEKAALLNAVVDRARADLNDGKPLAETVHDNDVEQRILTAIKQDQHLASLTVVRAAIADVLDTGFTDEDVRQRAWIFLLLESEQETERRTRFIDAVCQRIAQLQQPPHNMDAGRLRTQREHPPLRSLTEAAEDAFNAAWAQSPPSMRNYVERDVAQFFYLMGQRDGLATAAEALNEDLQEIGRLARERL
jgi:hypothetical protein